MRVYAAIAILVIVLPLAGLGAVLWESRHFVAPGPATAETTVIVAPRESLRAVAQRLENAGVIDSATLFRIGVRFRGAATNLKAGEYAIPAHASQARIMAMLVAHAVVLHRITIAEGLTSAMAVAAIGADTVLTGPLVMPPAEGSLLPETYLFERGTTRQDLVRRMEKAQADLLAKLWAKRKAGLPLKSPEEAIILASMVEKETAIAAERPRIAAVFVNRLKLGMKLESDPTIIYGLTKGVPLGHRIRQSELAAANPYSTYQIAGLPPTPICNPGKDSIAAVLAPPDTDELYFVADGSGGHVFARTLAEHEKNVAKWRQIEQAQAGGRHPGRLH
jgi:peptidoglycan lytic transglycosylase G